MVCHHPLQRLVELANKHNVVLVPYGGGTNVTNALKLNPDENRMIVSVDLSRMNRIKWVDKTNMMACIEAGIIGQDLERDLKEYGLTLGHEPVSIDRVINCGMCIGFRGVFDTWRLDIDESQWHEEELLRKHRRHRSERQASHFYCNY